MGIHNNNIKNQNKNISSPTNLHPNQSLYFRKTSVSEVNNIIAGMRNDIAPGRDGI